MGGAGHRGEQRGVTLGPALERAIVELPGCARRHRQGGGPRVSRRDYHRAYYWRRVEQRREQRIASHRRLGKAHRYSVELARETRP